MKFFNALQLKLHIEFNKFSTYSITLETYIWFEIYILLGTYILLQTYILLDSCCYSNDIQLEMELFEISKSITIFNISKLF